MAFITDPRLRQTWNQLSHTTETVTSDAAAGLWSFGHRYVNPCLSSLAGAVESCTAVCLGDRDERARRARERERGARRLGTTRRRRGGVEYSFDFYDDWEEEYAAEEFGGVDDDDEVDGEAGGSGGSGRGRGLLGGWGRAEDWDRLLAGSGPGKGRRYGGVSGGGTGDVVDQPRRKRGMSYGTRGAGGRRKVSGEEDPNVIPRTAPLGFLGRLPFKIVGSLRYKPSAANLREHPGGGGGAVGMAYHGEGAGGEDHEHEPLLGTSDEGNRRRQGPRPRSDTTNSGNSSSSYRSRGDLFPSDEEGDEDAVPLDDEFTVALERVDDRGSTRTRSSKGKRPAGSDKSLSRTVSRTTILSTDSPGEYKSGSHPVSPREAGDMAPVPSLEDLQREEEQAEREEREEIERRRRAASQLALERGLNKDNSATAEVISEAKDELQKNMPQESPTQEPPAYTPSITTGEGNPEPAEEPKPLPATPKRAPSPTKKIKGDLQESTFVPARLPHFG